MSTLRAILPAAPLSPDDTYTLEHRVIHNADVDALTTLFVSNRACIFGLVVRYVRDANEAESLVQETYLQAITCIHRFRGDSKVSTWLCAIALNLARAHVRKHRRQSYYEADVLERIQSNHRRHHTPPDPERCTIRRHHMELVHDALKQLPEAYRQVITLRDLKQLSTQETATQLDINEVNVRVRLHRARRALSDLLAPYFAAA